MTSWQGAVTLDLNQAILAADPTIDDQYPLIGASNIQFSMNNTLTAVAEDIFASAFIDKKRVSIRPVLATVPEPATIGQLLSLVLLSPRFRRKR